MPLLSRAGDGNGEGVPAEPVLPGEGVPPRRSAGGGGGEGDGDGQVVATVDRQASRHLVRDAEWPGKPGAPFAVRHLPRAGTVLKPGQSFTVQVSYRPGRAGARAATLAVTGSSGTRAIISISGKARTAVSRFTAPRRVSFGTVTVGHTVTRFVHIVNVGNQNATVARTGLTEPFHAPYQVAQGLPVNSGYDLSIPITFTPSASGRITGRYTFTWRDRLGRHTLTVPITGTGQ